MAEHHHSVDGAQRMTGQQPQLTKEALKQSISILNKQLIRNKILIAVYAVLSVTFLFASLIPQLGGGGGMVLIGIMLFALGIYLAWDRNKENVTLNHDLINKRDDLQRMMEK